MLRALGSDFGCVLLWIWDCTHPPECGPPAGKANPPGMQAPSITSPITLVVPLGFITTQKGAGEEPPQDSEQLAGIETIVIDRPKGSVLTMCMPLHGIRVDLSQRKHSDGAPSELI